MDIPVANLPVQRLTDLRFSSGWSEWTNPCICSKKASSTTRLIVGLGLGGLKNSKGAQSRPFKNRSFRIDVKVRKLRKKPRCEGEMLRKDLSQRPSFLVKAVVVYGYLDPPRVSNFSPRSVAVLLVAKGLKLQTSGGFRYIVVSQISGIPKWWFLVSLHVHCTPGGHFHPFGKYVK